MQDITPKQAALKTITDAVESEFPHDRALQQIHIARKLLSLEAGKSGMTLFQ